jgi:hypothetical protein
VKAMLIFALLVLAGCATLTLERAKRAKLKSEPQALPPMPKIERKQRDLAGPIVIGGMAIIALALSFVGVSYVIGTEPPARLQHMIAASISGHAR